MKQTQFETRQRSEQMLQQATALWQRSAFSEQLEELGKDPVFTLLMTALAYQANELDGEIERIRQEVIEDLTRTLIPYELTHANPATVLVSATPANGIPEMEVHASTPFTLADTSHSFLPLFRTRVLPAQIKSILRMDGRRWKVSIAFDTPVDNLSGFCFAIRNSDFRDLIVSVNNRPLPLVRPLDYAQLPIDPAFGADTMLYNNLHAHIADTACIDLFAQQNVRLFFVQPHEDRAFYPTELEKIDLVFEFTGITDAFAFSKSDIVLNSVLLVNATLHTATLSPVNPIVRAVGDEPIKDYPEQFMHMVCPSEEQLYGDSTIEVRQVAADRFNRGSLIRLLSALNAKYHTDYPAFQDIKSTTNDDTAQQLQQLLAKLEETVNRSESDAVPGVYMILRQSQMDKQGSVDIRYLTTSGAAINTLLSAESRFIGPKGLDGKECLPVTEPIPGTDQLNDFISGMETARYLVATGDRIVTPADIRMFCHKELLTRYGITREMVQNITVSHRNSNDMQGCGYEIVVDITLTGNNFVQKALAEKKNFVETMLQKMMEVRSTNIYPICVTIQIVEQHE